MDKSLLIIFVKNPVWGKVKTRLAATVGPDRALQVYRLLLQRTKAVTLPLEMDKVVFFSDHLGDGADWQAAGYDTQVQQGQDLGERMAQAFAFAFARGYSRVGIIGSDCHELSTGILQEAFALLATHELVIGPAVDGGYYFLGTNHYRPELFRNKTWSTAEVLGQTLADARKGHLKTALLPELSDVDEEKDLATIPGFGFV